MFRKSSRLSFLLVFIAGLLLNHVLLAETPTLRIPRVIRAPRLEEFISGTPREAEAVVTDLRQFDPGDGVPVSQPTTAFLSYDDRNLYVAFVCKDDPRLIRARMTKRDVLLSDDRVSIGIDTFHDHHRNVWFDANPLGVQMDGITTDGVDDFDFDTLWYSEGRLTADGYVVLETIPFKSLRFPKTPVQDWGIVLIRMIQRNNEMSCWPYITRRLLPGWTSQFAHLEGVQDISPGRNLQFIPYGLFSRAHYLETPSAGTPLFKTENDPRVGLDAKMVLQDALTLDMTLNPDFSQVESDEPQVTVNQRYEVFFPEKRPFFIENADFFKTPENLFFSRRIVDPQVGLRLTGKLGRWGIGTLAADDRAPGKLVSETDSARDRHAGIGVLRLYREIGKESRIGMLATSEDFAHSFNRVMSLDTYLKLDPNWTFSGQVISSETRQLDGQHFSGPAFLTSLSRMGRYFQSTTSYRDRSPGFRSEAGFIPRSDIRELGQHLEYKWRPEGKSLVSIGPALTLLSNWDRKGRLQDWEIEPELQIELTGMTRLVFERSENYELFENLSFRKYHNRMALNTEWLRWLSLEVSHNQGLSTNYYPATGLAPFMARTSSSTFGFTLRPNSQLRLDESYIYSWLGTREGFLLGNRPLDASIFNNHIVRTKLNYQFNRELSLRTIVDYNAVLPNATLVSLERTKKIGADVLLTYLLHPGTALYVGYTDLYENLALNPNLSPYLQRSAKPDTSVGRQLFIKLSYLFRM